LIIVDGLTLASPGVLHVTCINVPSDENLSKPVHLLV
jgi:hypothetical protein